MMYLVERVQLWLLKGLTFILHQASFSKLIIYLLAFEVKRHLKWNLWYMWGNIWSKKKKKISLSRFFCSSSMFLPTSNLPLEKKNKLFSPTNLILCRAHSHHFILSGNRKNSTLQSWHHPNLCHRERKDEDVGRFSGSALVNERLPFYTGITKLSEQRGVFLLSRRRHPVLMNTDHSHDYCLEDKTAKQKEQNGSASEKSWPPEWNVSILRTLCISASLW